MLFLYLMLVLSLQLIQCREPSTDRYLQYRVCTYSCNINFAANYPNQVQIIQIFSPFVAVDIYGPDETFISVLQVGFMVKLKKQISIKIETKKSYFTVWYRVITLPENVSFGYNSPVNLNFGIARNMDFSITITQNNFFDRFHYNYQTWVVPIFPKGQLQSWANNYPTTANPIINVINGSVDYDYLQSNGILIKDRFLSDRRAYTYLIILRIVDKNQNELQLNPAIIYGCLSYDVFSSFDRPQSFSALDINSSCQKLYMGYTWFIVSCAILSFVILFALIGFSSESIKIFLHTWIIVAYASSIGFHYIIQNIYTVYYGFYITIFGFGIPIAFFWTILLVKVTKPGNRFRILSSSICAILVALSILYFSLECLQNPLYLLIAGIIVIVLLFILLMLCNGFTLTVGRLFIDIFLICFGFSITLVQYSMFSFLFLDFLNFILFRGQLIHYFSFFLWNDVIMLSLWMFLTILCGVTSHRSWRKKNITVEPTSNRPETGRNYGATHQNHAQHITTSFVTTIVPENIPPNQVQPSAPYSPNDLPPPYSSVCQ